jgi:hypothetical protein
MTKITIAAVLMAATLAAACSRAPEGKAPTAATTSSGVPTAAEVEAARAMVKVTPAVPDDVRGEDRRRMQAEMIETMADQPEVSPEVYEGEAYRRGVTLTPAQIARKKASYRPTPATPAK